MALSPNDLKISILPVNPLQPSFKCVVGKEFSFKIRLKNDSTTDPIYNVGLNLNLPNGISFVTSSIISTTNTINVLNQNIVTFVNVIDLYPNSQPYDVTITLTINPYYRGTNLPVPYGTAISNIIISATGDSKPRGSYESGNTQVSSQSTTTITAIRYSATILGPTKYLKGAGVTPGPTIDATSIFNMSIELNNSIRDTSNISLIINLPNGFRYIGVWSTSGTDAVNFNNPLITNVSQSQNYVKINLNNKTLSMNSSTTLTFQVAIWNNYTLNGIENSGATILDGDALSTSITVTGNNELYQTSFDVTALNLVILQTTETEITDVSVLNEYTLNYSTSEYHIISNAIFTFIIPDGMSYVSGSSTVTPTNIETIDNTTVLTWDVNSIAENTDQIIKLYSLTNATYSSGGSVFSTDKFITYFNAEYISPDSSDIFTDSTFVIMNIIAPIISTNVEGYYYSDLVQKSFDVAAIQDYVKFSISYDASNLVATQHQVTLYDYPPYNLSAANVTNIQVSGDFPPGTSYYPMPDNGAKIPLGDLAGGTQFQITFYLPVTEGLQDSMIYNLAKCVLYDSNSISTALRDSSLVYFGIPHLSIEGILNNINCLSLEKTFTYDITVANIADQNANYIVDAYNIDFTASIPSILQIVGEPTITGATSHGNLTIVNNNYSMDIYELEPGALMTISTQVVVNELPIFGKEYSFTTAITNGTSQASPDSYHYTYNEYPLDNTQKINGCIPTITKVYIPSTVKLYEEYLSTVTIVFPAGCLGYNTKIKDSLVTTNSSNLKNVTLNGQPATYSLSTNNITVPVEPILDTTDGPVTYVFQYNDKVLTATPINYEQNRTTTASIDWSEELNIPETHQEVTTATIKIVVPGIIPTLYQNNSTLGYSYDKTPINGRDNDLINYKINLINVGKSAGYYVNIYDSIPINLTYLSNNIGGTYNTTSRMFSGNIPTLDINESVDVIIQCKISNDDSLLIAQNSSSIDYKPNDIIEPVIITASSNTTYLYSSNLINCITKYQRNSTIDEEFTTSTIRCFNGQNIQYKGIIFNPLNTTMTNIVIEDTFPIQFTFVSHDPFIGGNISVLDNIVTITVPSLPPNSSLQYIYTLKLESNLLSLESSSASMDYTFTGANNTFTITSNTLYVKLSDLGKGFKFY